MVFRATAIYAAVVFLLAAQDPGVGISLNGNLSMYPCFVLAAAAAPRATPPRTQPSSRKGLAESMGYRELLEHYCEVAGSMNGQ